MMQEARATLEVICRHKPSNPSKIILKDANGTHINAISNK